MFMKSEIGQHEVSSTMFVRGNFESKLQVLCMCMMLEVMAILLPFMSFATIYNANKTHNMFMFMLDPWAPYKIKQVKKWYQMLNITSQN
jgi:hypothetical protein